MPEKVTKKEKIACSEHNFFMRAKNRNCYYQYPLNLDMCRSECGTKKKKKQSNCYQGPIFNKDRNCHTPTFILASEKKKFQQIDLSMNIESNNKLYAMRHEKSLMLEPKPNSKSMFCSVCKERYEDYLEHISKPKHKMNIHTNIFTQYILEEAENFKDKKQISTPSVTTESTNLIVISSDEQQDVEKLGKARKRVKRCPEYEQVKKDENKKQKETVEKKQQNGIEMKGFQPLGIGNGCNPYNFNFSYNFNFMGLPNVNPVQNMFQGLPQMNMMPNFAYFPPQIMNQEFFNRTFFNNIQHDR